MAKIGIFNNETGALFQDNSITIQQNQQNNMQTAQMTEAPVDTDSWKPISLVMDSSHNKIDFYRVIMALYQEGFFKSANGGRATIKEVFHAFGTMLKENFDGYAKDISAGSLKKTELTIFTRLEQAFMTYEQEKEQKANSRR